MPASFYFFKKMWLLGEVKTTRGAHAVRPLGSAAPGPPQGSSTAWVTPESACHGCLGPPVSPRPDQKPAANRASACHFSGRQLQGLIKCLSRENAGREKVLSGPLAFLGQERPVWGPGQEVSGAQEIKGRSFSGDSELACVAAEATRSFIY